MSDFCVQYSSKDAVHVFVFVVALHCRIEKSIIFIETKMVMFRCELLRLFDCLLNFIIKFYPYRLILDGFLIYEI
jgi:hypothetical protein